MAKTRPLEDQSKEELIQFIRGTLNPREKETREALELYQHAFEGIEPPEQRGLLHIIRTMKEDPTSGAEMFIELGNTLLGRTEDDDYTPPTPPKDTPMSEDNTEAPAWAQALLAKVEALEAAQTTVIQSTEAQEIAAFKAEARKLGYVEGTDDWVTFFKIAASDLADGDLDEAHALFTKLYGEPTDEADNLPDEEDEADAKPDPKFPATGGAGGSGSPTPAATADPLPMDKDSVHARAQAFLSAASAGTATVGP